MAVDIGASLVDINMGCPAKRVVAGACGSALMKEPELAQELVRAVRAAVPADKPVTVKHRAGWDERHLNAPEFACAMVEAGAAMITVHGRTRTQGFSGKSDRGIIGKVRAAVPAHVPIVGNGDVLTVDDYFRMREETGCDAVMIGRGASSNPWIFRQIQQYLATGRYDEPTHLDRYRMMRQYYDMLIARREDDAVGKMKQFATYFTHGVRHGAQLRVSIYQAHEAAAILELVDKFFHSEPVLVP
jgi:nifR3 family TIM-barrel protein